MKIFKSARAHSTRFAWSASKERVTDDELKDLASQLENDQADANLGAGGAGAQTAY